MGYEEYYIEDLGFLGYDAVPLGQWFPTFRTEFVPLFSVVMMSQKNAFLWDLLTIVDEGASGKINR
jgi:hypothetical protein